MWECRKCSHENEDADNQCWSCGETGLIDKLTDKDAVLKSHGTCPNCGSDKIIPSVMIVDHDGDDHDTNLTVRIDRNPNAILMKGAEVSSLRAWICGNCGYSRLFASNPNALWAAYEVSQR